MTFWSQIQLRRYRSVHEWKIKNRVAAKEQAGDACCTVPWSKGKGTLVPWTHGLSSRRYWVRAPWGSLRLLSLKVRTPAPQAGDDGFKVYAPLRSVLDVVHRTTAPRRSYCGYRITEVRQIVVLLMGVRLPLVTLWMGMPSGEVAMVRWTMSSNAPKVRILPQTLQGRDGIPGSVSLHPLAPRPCGTL